MITISKTEAKRILSDKFASITFEKKNGETRKMNGRLGVKRYLKGGTNANSDKDNFLIFWENGIGYRTINLETVSRIAARGKVYLIK